jgi:hypothetical protein
MGQLFAKNMAMKIDEAGKNDTARRINNGFSLQVAMMRNINAGA